MNNNQFYSNEIDISKFPDVFNEAVEFLGIQNLDSRDIEGQPENTSLPEAPCLSN